jgi:putative peptidoglycan lipid II flippase
MRDSESQQAGYSWARASAVMMTAILASRLLGMLRDTVIAFRFGQNELTDAYRAAFQLPDLLFFMAAGGALSSSLMPIFSRYWETGQREEAWRVFSIVATVMVSLTTALVLALEILAPLAVALMFPGFDAQRLALTTHMTRIVLPAQICFLLGGLMMATLYARKHFLAPALGPNIYNIGIIFGGLVLALWLGVSGLAWGALAGAFVGSVLLPLVVMRRLGSAFRLEFNLRHEGAREVFRLMLPVMFGLSLPGIYMLILRVFASWLPAGAISALDNANRQMQAPLGIVGQGIALAIFPALTTLAAREEWGALRETLRRGLRLVWFLTAPATVLLLVLAEDISRILLQYGKFTPTDTQLVASALRAFALGLFAWSGSGVDCAGLFRAARFADARAGRLGGDGRVRAAVRAADAPAGACGAGVGDFDCCHAADGVDGAAPESAHSPRFAAPRRTACTVSRGDGHRRRADGTCRRSRCTQGCTPYCPTFR